ncbi:MAG TPA: VWA domain-containing protein [Thermoanaerobaculia bacterium]
MSTTRRILTLTLGLTLTSTAAWAPPAAGQEEPPRPEFEERVEVTEVLLDVLVTDRRGNVVLGLGAEDFVVEEDGEAVELTDVTFYSNRRFLESAERAAELGIEPAAVPTNRYFILFFHDQRDLLPRITAQLLDAGRRAKLWVRSELLPNDYVAVVGYDYALQIFQDFTTDEEAVAKAIDQAVRGEDPKHWPSRMEETEGPSLLANLPSAEAIRSSSQRFYGAMEILAQAAGGVPGRKNVVLFSLGFGRVGNFGMYTPDSRYYQPMVRELNDNNVAVYSIDLISIDPGDSLLDNVYANSLSNLSSDTGGRYYFNFVNFSTPLEQVAEDNGGYYLLAYRSPHPAGESGYQDVTVRTVNASFRVRAREGYQWGDGPGE